MQHLQEYQLYDKNIANDAVSRDLPKLMRQAAVLETVLWMRANHPLNGAEYRQRARQARQAAMRRFWRRKEQVI